MGPDIKILNTISYYGMLEKGEKVLVGVSGGPDSVFLMRILDKLKARLDIRLSVAHIDHGIRGAASSRDAEFVKNLAKTLGIKFLYKKLKPPQKAKSMFSLEERLREERYDFFKNAAVKLGIRTVATAHTLDDQAETVLMRILKGATLRGVVGIHPVRIDKKVKFIRPLLEIEKKEILEYLRTKRIPFRIDATNAENKFLRNNIRNRIIPYLEKINPRLKRSLSNLAESLRGDFEFIEEEAKKLKPAIRSGKHLRYVLLRDILLQPKALQKEILREAFRLAGGNIKKLTFRHWKDIDYFFRTKSTGKSLDLPGGVKVTKAVDRLLFTRGKRV
ncbi:MAG: tRNA lysidine(34) synthetase TilS [Omnitrophica bacterium]|nr:tRNA lysidine(34) synthetase TilS [Candidatus Omnitrophota bacterium]